jgi:hypothetical protein
MYASDSRPVASVRKGRNSDSAISQELPDERKTIAVPEHRRRCPRQLDAGPLAPDVASFRLHLAAENKAAGTIRIYTEAPLWFASASLLRETGKTS